jgi:hypothetical protein
MASRSPHRSHSHSRSKYVLFDKGQGEQAQQIHIVDGGISGHREAARLGISGGESAVGNQRWGGSASESWPVGTVSVAGRS